MPFFSPLNCLMDSFGRQMAEFLKLRYIGMFGNALGSLDSQTGTCWVFYTIIVFKNTKITFDIIFAIVQLKIAKLSWLIFLYLWSYFWQVKAKSSTFCKPFSLGNRVITQHTLVWAAGLRTRASWVVTLWTGPF